LRTRPAGEDEIRVWFELDPGTGIGIIAGRPSGVVVVDVDDPDDETLPELPETTTVSTPRGGWHAYFLGGDDIRSRTFGWGELRADGLYVVAPASTGANRRAYRAGRLIEAGGGRRRRSGAGARRRRSRRRPLRAGGTDDVPQWGERRDGGRSCGASASNDDHGRRERNPSDKTNQTPARRVFHRVWSVRSVWSVAAIELLLREGLGRRATADEAPSPCVV
jgi:hypothetical protein